MTTSEKIRPTEPLALRRLQTDTLLELSRCLTSQDAHVRNRLEQAGLTGITAQQSRVLLILFQARTPLTARELARRMGVSEVTMSRFVQALQRENWISRSQNPEDGRSLLLAPTKKARKSFPGFVAVSNEVLDTLFTGFSDNDMWSFHELVGRIRTNLEARTSKPDIDKL